ncbi:DUF3039 domain-containing protein [Actinomyces gerencseriae]|uniref:DUF3039 domain-containing protein n=1 Tax=Actinomyces gerencseriae TaxID=52769 RepID=UPI0012EC1E1B
MESSPGRVAHWVNRRGIGDACVNGAAVRSLCGGLFRSQNRSRRAPRVRGVRSALQATAADMILGAGPPSRAFRPEAFRREAFRREAFRREAFRPESDDGVVRLARKSPPRGWGRLVPAQEARDGLPPLP